MQLSKIKCSIFFTRTAVMLYSYIALNTENQKLKGVIAADNEVLAKKKLHQVGLSVLSLRETSKDEEASINEEKNTKKLPGFTFFVIDPQGKQLSGSIEATDRKNALKRLAEEYGFEILSLCENAVPEDLRYKKGMEELKTLEEELEDEFGITFKHSKEGKAEQEKSNEMYDESFQEERKEILKEIDLVSKKTQEILKQHQSKIPAEEYDEIANLLSQLSRLRFSNNFQLIRKLIEDLFSKIDETMKKYIMVDADGNYQEMLEEEENLEDILHSRGGSAHKDVLEKLKKASSSLDKFIGDTFSSNKKRKKKDIVEEHIFTEVSEDASFFRRIIKSFLQAFFTQNASLKKERMKEVKKKYELWKKVKEQREEARRKARIKKKLTEANRSHNLSKEAQILLWIIDEFYTFIAALLIVLFATGYMAFLIKENVLPFDSPFLFAITHSEILPKMAIMTFFLFAIFALRKKFFPRNLLYSTLFIFFTGLMVIIYFYNL